MDKATETAGPLIIGHLASWGVQGILCVQVYQYYLAFPKDRLFIKVLVYTVFTLEVVQSILMTKDAFDTFVLGFADISALNKIRLLWFSLPVLGAMVGSICRVFFIYRLHILSRSWVPTSLAIMLALMAAVAALLTGARFAVAWTFDHLYDNKSYTLVGLWNGSSAACDIIIAACMVYYLLRQKADFKRTHARITSLIVVTVETGIFTATISSLTFLLFVCLKQTGYFAIPIMIVAKLYSNTMLLALNNRINIIGGRNKQETYIDQPFGVQDPSQWEPHRDLEGKNSSRANIELRENSISIDQFGFPRDQTSGVTKPANTLNKI